MAKIYEGDFTYLQDEMDIHPLAELFEECLEAMHRYPSPWWFELRNDPAALAAKQIHEPALLVRMNTFKKGVEKVIGRKLAEGELTFKNMELKKEFDEKYQAMNA